MPKPKSNAAARAKRHHCAHAPTGQGDDRERNMPSTQEVPAPRKYSSAARCELPLKLSVAVKRQMAIGTADQIEKHGRRATDDRDTRARASERLATGSSTNRRATQRPAAAGHRPELEAGNHGCDAAAPMPHATIGEPSPVSVLQDGTGLRAVPLPVSAPRARLEVPQPGKEPRSPPVPQTRRPCPVVPRASACSPNGDTTTTPARRAAPRQE